MIDITKSKDAARVLRNAVMLGVNPKGTWIKYHTGEYQNEIGLQPVGIEARSLFDLGKVDLFQKKLDDCLYDYYAVIKENW